MLQDMVHELTHVFGLHHKCGNWDYTDANACVMNYEQDYLFGVTPPYNLVYGTNFNVGLKLCLPHIMAIRRTKLENHPTLGW